MNRITNTNKWKDSWFLKLSPNGKLLFMFLCDNCDEAGFYALDSSFMQKQLNMPAKQVVTAVKEISEKLVFAKSGKRVWVRNFLFYQKKLPLDITNDEHKNIKLVLEKNISLFEHNEGMSFIIDKVETGKKKRASTPRKKFEKPALDEFEAYGKEYAEEKGLKVAENWYGKIYAHYESNGWKVGKNPMVDWKAAIRTNIGKENKPNPTYQNNGSTGRINKLQEANSQIEDIQID